MASVYLFPAYILALTLLLSCLNWYSTLGARIVGNNILNVLATVLLLCSTKCLRIIAETLSYTTLTSSLGYTRKVWLYDGSLLFMHSKHLALSFAAMITLTCFIIPFTLHNLLEYPLLKTKMRRVITKLRLHQFIALYQKPYKEPFRWWTGMTLVVRMLLLFAFQFNILGNQRLNLLIIVSLGICVLGSMWNFGTVYHDKICMMLETFYIVNLVLLAGWTEYVDKSNNSLRKQLIISYFFISLALVVFATSILCHVCCKIRSGKKSAGGNNNCSTIIETLKHRLGKKLPEATLELSSSSGADKTPPTGTTTYVMVTDKGQKPLTEPRM